MEGSAGVAAFGPVVIDVRPDIILAVHASNVARCHLSEHSAKLLH